MAKLNQNQYYIKFVCHKAHGVFSNFIEIQIKPEHKAREIFMSLLNEALKQVFMETGKEVEDKDIDFQIISLLDTTVV